MNVKQIIGLLIVYVGYLLLGAMLFYYLEKDNEVVKRREDYRMYQNLLVVLRNHGINETTALTLEGYCGRPLTENADIDQVSQEYWSFYKSVVFVLTVVSTVGYGNIHPTMPLTRHLMIIYAVIGLPINGILLTSLASFFSTVFIRAHKKYKIYESRFGLTVDIISYLIPGILVFIFLPAIAFHYFEEWSYEESVYFAFVTLTTIGFGDYVAGQKNYKTFSKEAVVIYKALLLGWVIFGLGYLIMLLEYLTRAMRSKKVVKLEQKLLEVLTRSKIWNGFTKDLGYMRRIMNELYLDKFKPVFRDEHLRYNRKLTFRKSKSLPNIIFGVEEETLPFEESNFPNRKRAHSEFVPSRLGLTRVFSESDLRRIDRHATFASATSIRPSELLRQVVGAMGDSIMRTQDDSSQMGINVFSDDEILQSERWFEKGDNPFANLYHPASYEDIVTAKRRERALSEIPAPRSNPQTITAGMDWTWAGSGATKIFKIVNEQHKSLNSSPSFLTGTRWFNPVRKKRLYSESPDDSDGSRHSVAQNSENRFFDNIRIREGGQRKTSLCESGAAKYLSDISYMTHTAGTGTNGLGLMHGKMNPRKAQLNESQRLLDETSLGDFLRALTVVHNRVGSRQTPDEPRNPTREPLSRHSASPFQSRSLTDLSPAEDPPPGPLISGAPLNRTESMPLASADNCQPSNLKRLGRFLLRSYSSKSESDVSFGQLDNPKAPFAESETSLPNRMHDGEFFAGDESFAADRRRNSGNVHRADSRRLSPPRQTISRRRQQGDHRIVKPTLTNVREVIN